MYAKRPHITLSGCLAFRWHNQSALLHLIIIAALLEATTPFHILMPTAPSRSGRQSRSSLHMLADDISSDTISYSEAARIRTQNGHDAAIHHYQQLLLQNPQDTSAATRIAASKESLRVLARIGWSYAELDNDHPSSTQEDLEGDIAQLQSLLYLGNYCHSSLREHIFNLPTGINHHISDDRDNGEQYHHQQSLEMYKNDYPMGPTYVRQLVAGQGVDLSSMIDTSGTKSTLGNQNWLPSLQCLTTLFLLSSCVPKQLLLDSIMGGRESLELLLRLGLVFIYDTRHELEDQIGNDSRYAALKEGDEWVVPLIHLFPLEIPPLRPLSPLGGHTGNSDEDRRPMVLMTDLHPTVLGMTSIPEVVESNESCGGANQEGAVMYIGPDSLALVHHLHASMPQYLETKTAEEQSSFGRILDVCTGSGVLALATLAMLDAANCHVSNLVGIDSMAVAVDINERALRFTRFNAHLNGYSDKISTVHADLLSGEAYPTIVSQQTDHQQFKEVDESLVKVLLNKLVLEEDKQGNNKRKQKFDIFLANPPFIPVPPSRSDGAASALRENDMYGSIVNTPRYGLFSSGGPDGEDCLHAIVEMAPLLLRSDGSLLAIVSEFMNPPSPSMKQTMSHVAATKDDDLTSKIERWWGSKSSTTVSSNANGILFTNELAINSHIYAQRRAMKNDEDDFNVWKDHLNTSGIKTVSPGLLFVRTMEDKSNGTKGLRMKHQFVPKTKYGSVWTPHNFVAVEYTRDALLNLFQ